MKLTSTNSKNTLTVEWSNPLFDDYRKVQIENMYAASLIQSADGSIDSLCDIFNAARKDCFQCGPAYQAYLKLDAIARANATAGHRMLVEEKEDMRMSIRFEREK